MPSRRVLVLSRGEESTVDRLKDEAAEVARLKALLSAAEARRNLLILKLRHAGLPGRFIEQHAGMSNVAIFQLEKRAGRAATA